MTFPPGFHFGFNVRYQSNVNMKAENPFTDTFVKQHGELRRYKRGAKEESQRKIEEDMK